MWIFRDSSLPTIAPTLCFLVALVCNIGFLVGGVGAAPLGLEIYDRARYERDGNGTMISAKELTCGI